MHPRGLPPIAWPPRSRALLAAVLLTVVAVTVASGCDSDSACRPGPLGTYIEPSPCDPDACPPDPECPANFTNGRCPPPGGQTVDETFPTFPAPDTRTCRLTRCNGRGQCVTLELGGTGCDCDLGYVSADCRHCAAGFHRKGQACVADVSCLPTTCNGRGECRDEDEGIDCVCEAGWTGPNCIHCDGKRGFAPADGGCIWDPCRARPCRGSHRRCVIELDWRRCECESGFYEIEGRCVPFP